MDFETLIEGADLSEDFKTKTKVLFESAVNTKVAHLVEQKEQEFMKLVEEKDSEYKKYVEEQLEETTNKLDEYLDYVVSEWFSDNKLAIESGTRLELAESLFSGLKTLFVEHNIDVPEDKVDALSTMEESLKETTSKLNEQIEVNASMFRSLKDLKRTVALTEATRGLIDTKAERLKQLAETVSFEDDESFRRKLDVLKTTALNEVAKDEITKLPESSAIPGTIIESKLPSADMEIYVKALSRPTQNKF